VHVCNFITTQFSLVINIAIVVDILKIKCNCCRGGTSAEGTGGSIRTSRHSALLKVAEHSRCRKMFAVHPPHTSRCTGSGGLLYSIGED